MDRTRIKFCGMTSVADIALAVEAGADAVGVILAPASPRKVTVDALPILAAAIPPLVTRVGVVTSPSESDAARLQALGFTLQFSGEESAADCRRLAGGRPYIKTFHVSEDGSHADAAFERLAEYRDALAMLDTRSGGRFGGTGVSFPWNVAAPLARSRRVVISGGLSAANVGACIRMLRPYAVDVRGGIETDDRKDAGKMHAFVRAVRQADAVAATT
ncbi:MAG: phosphoribosylanthranilate isomerase [Candidatus Eremiobacteraeota bacterium]|nr:phosphoribosylanthranilate isomerase [Candidatus Eremiobacteraeota bacterium]MBC5803945.1 phosphoribosylanthranilate isomerase [Candidatus Eremiobacteraeota bacterium]